MFTLATPITTPNRFSVAGFSVELPAPNNYAPIGRTEPTATAAVIVAPVVNIVAGIATTPVVADTNPRILTIDGLIYHFTLINPPPKGEFTIVNGELIIGLYTTSPIQVINYNSPPILIRTNSVPAPYPEILSQFPLKGDLSWSQTWEEQPTAQFTFITFASQRDAVIKYFSRHQRITIYGVGFAPIGQLSITEISLTKSAIPLIEVNINLTGYHAKALETYTTLRDKVVTIFASTPATTTYSDLTSTTVQDLARKVGTTIVGDLINIDAETVNETTSATTLGERLQTADIRSIGCFVDYADPVAIVLRKYHNVVRHTVTQADIHGDIQASFNNRTNATTTEAGYYKTYDPGTEISYGSGATTTAKTQVDKTKWQPKQPELTDITEGDPTASTSPYIGFVRDLSAVFDISGKRKRFKTTKLRNGQPISSEQEEWGYVAVARDNAVISAGSTVINGTWQKISSSTTTYEYNSLGYLISSITLGTMLTRHQVENPQKPETLNFVITGPIVESTFDPYRFKTVPTRTTETYTLEPFSKYYSDIKPATITSKVFLADGKTETEVVTVDKAWIPPYFVKSKVAIETATSIIANPKSTAEKPLPLLTTGKSSNFTETINIADRTNGKDPTSYTRTTDNQSAQGAQLGSNLSTAESTINSGRPPLAPNLGASLELVQPPEPKNPTDSNPQPFLIKSGVSNENVGIEGVNTLKFPIAKTQAAAIAAAQIDIDLINAKNTIQERLTVNFRPYIKPGDKLIYQVNGVTRSRRIVSVSQKLKIDGITNQRQPIVSSEGTSIQAGIDYPTPIVVLQSSATITGTRTP